MIVDLFTSKIYVYPTKNRRLLAKKMAIKALNKKFDVEIFHTKIRGEKAFAAEHEIREFKKILLRSKQFDKR